MLSSFFFNIKIAIRLYFWLKSAKVGYNTCMRKIILTSMLILISLPVMAAKRLHPEAEYQKAWCDKRGGVIEYELPDKCRVDCLLPDMAVEFDFANKWAECIGQSLYYGKMTNRQPACVLIMERGEKDLKYVKKGNFHVSPSSFLT